MSLSHRQPWVEMEPDLLHSILNTHMFSPFLSTASSPQSSNPNSASSADSPAGGGGAGAAGGGAPASPPQSPNSQLTMSLLNNLIQMQGLENTIAQQQATTSSGSPSSSSNNPGSSTTTGSNSSSTSSSSSSYNPQALEQQIKLSQLQQLQQLQNQIFQQQIALISGQSPSMLPSSLLMDAARLVGSGSGGGGGAAVAGGGDQFTGLPTPGTCVLLTPAFLFLFCLVVVPSL
ncbi:hypothetical protein M413DRAFT_270681 [Hebeloma cylindrosporum]|uniref:Uncharacterized protein n=1 Tax=Hebeloma cylindrosporum TaxID=76867 RepID=A0A0C3CSX6_HEBCY|nr:hypothetical protein M413DRAFT_270681 [Hebeloma cylindrosporum h7]